MVEQQKTIVSGRISTTVYRQLSRSHENPIKIQVRRNENTLAIYKRHCRQELSSHPASFDLEQYQESQGDAKEQ